MEEIISRRGESSKEMILQKILSSKNVGLWETFNHCGLERMSRKEINMRIKHFLLDRLSDSVYIKQGKGTGFANLYEKPKGKERAIKPEKSTSHERTMEGEETKKLERPY